MEGSERVESGDREALVRCTSEVHWDSGVCKERIWPEGGGGGDCRDVCEGISGLISGPHDVRAVESRGCTMRGRRVGEKGGSVACGPLLAGRGEHC